MFQKRTVNMIELEGVRHGKLLTISEFAEFLGISARAYSELKRVGGVVRSIKTAKALMKKGFELQPYN